MQALRFDRRLQAGVVDKVVQMRRMCGARRSKAHKFVSCIHVPFADAIGCHVQLALGGFTAAATGCFAREEQLTTASGAPTK